MQINKIEITLVDVSKIIPYWRNPRRNDKTVEWLCQIIPQYGFNVPIVLDRQNVVIKGHARLKAAKRLGLTQVPCIYSDNDDEHNKADRIADNKIQEMSYWDFAKLEMEYQRIGELKFDKLFHPEELTPMDYQPEDMSDFAPASIEDYGDYTSGEDQPPMTYSYSNEGTAGATETHYGAFENGEEGSVGEAAESLSEGPSGPSESVLPKGNRALKTLCPYCGATVYIRL